MKARCGSLAGLAGLLLFCIGSPALASEPRVEDTVGSGKATPLRLVAIGDSVMWGQGLSEGHKATKLVQKWLAEKLSRRVTRAVHAQSGAELRAHPTHGGLHSSEIPSSLPTIGAQLEEVRNPHTVDVVMLNGCINDFEGERILGGNSSKADISQRASKKCYGAVKSLLEQAALRFPNAVIVDVGYYPLFTKNPSGFLAATTFLEVQNLWCEHNCFNMDLDLKGRSRAFYDASNAAIEKAVGEVSAANHGRKILFAKWPYSEAGGYGSSQSQVWSITDKDDVQFQRIPECVKLFEKTKSWRYATYCNKAATLHPNHRGAQVMATAVEDALKPYLATLQRHPRVHLNIAK